MHEYNHNQTNVWQQPFFFSKHLCKQCYAAFFTQSFYFLSELTDQKRIFYTAEFFYIVFELLQHRP